MLAARMASGAGPGGDREAGAALARAPERQAERELASAAGTSLEDAGRAIDVGRALAQLPDLDAAARGGVLSRRQAAPISDAALDPAAAPDLVDKPGRLALGELQAECAWARRPRWTLSSGAGPCTQPEGVLL